MQLCSVCYIHDGRTRKVAVSCWERRPNEYGMSSSWHGQRSLISEQAPCFPFGRSCSKSIPSAHQSAVAFVSMSGRWIETELLLHLTLLVVHLVYDSVTTHIRQKGRVFFFFACARNQALSTSDSVAVIRVDTFLHMHRYENGTMGVSS